MPISKRWLPMKGTCNVTMLLMIETVLVSCNCDTTRVQCIDSLYNIITCTYVL